MTTPETITETVITITEDITFDIAFDDDVVVAEGTVFDETPVRMTDGLRARIVADRRREAISALDEINGQIDYTSRTDGSPNVGCAVTYGIGNQKQFVAPSEEKLWDLVIEWAVNG